MGYSISNDRFAIHKFLIENGAGVGDIHTSQFLGIELDGELVLGVRYDNYQVRSIQFHIAKSEKANAIPPRYLYLGFFYPFEQLKVEKILCFVSSTNTKTLKLCSGLGFKELYRIAYASPDGDLVIFSMEKTDCRWLGKRYEKYLERNAARGCL